MNKVLAISIIFFVAIYGKEESYSKLIAVDTDFSKKEIDLRIVIEDEESVNKVAMYFDKRFDGNYKFAIYLDKEQREKIIELYQKYEEWKKVAIENQVSHTKELGLINRVEAYLYYGDQWYKTYSVSISLLAGVGDFNAMNFIFSPFESIDNQFIDEQPPALMFIDKGGLTQATADVMSALVAELGSDIPKSIYDELNQNNLNTIKNNYENKQIKKKNLDALFE